MSSLDTLLENISSWLRDEASLRERRRVRLRLEELEQREVPAGFGLPTQATLTGPAAAASSSYAQERMQRFTDIIAEMQQGPRSIALLGDSNVQRFATVGAAAWNPTFGAVGAADLGVGGITTQELLWLLRAGVLASSQPSVVVIGVGTANLLYGQSPRAAAEGLAAVIDEVRRQLPSARIVVVGALPLGDSTADPLRQVGSDFNRLAAWQAQRLGAQFVNPGASFLERNGALSKTFLTEDRLHITAAGYEYYSQALLGAILGPRTRN